MFHALRIATRYIRRTFLSYRRKNHPSLLNSESNFDPQKLEFRSSHVSSSESTHQIDPAADRWRVIGSSVTGSRHIQEGKSCEDAAGWIVLGENVFLVIADGAGSAKYAERGSILAVRAAISAATEILSLEQLIDHENASLVLEQIFESARKSLSNEAKRLRIQPDDLACTLLAVIAKPDFVAAGQIGDGAIVVADASYNLTQLTTPTKGTFANETTFLVSTKTVSTSVFARSLRYILLFSDGLERLALKFPPGVPHLGFFIPLCKGFQNFDDSSFKASLREFLESPRVISRSDDDKTIVMAELLL